MLLGGQQHAAVRQAQSRLDAQLSEPLSRPRRTWELLNLQTLHDPAGSPDPTGARRTDQHLGEADDADAQVLAG